jgi:hypothetical protein
MVNLWIYEDKSIFLDHASLPLLYFRGLYIAMSMIVMFFPHIMYGLPLDLTLQPKVQVNKKKGNLIILY